MSGFTKEITTYTQKWSGRYRHIGFEIKFWKTESMENPEYADLYQCGGIWNSYISLNRKAIPKEFDSLLPKLKNYGKRKHFEYGSLVNLFDMQNGLSFFELIHDEESNISGFKVGNDYNHSWNHGGYDKEWILSDVKQSIDTFIERYPKYKAWSSIDGKWIINTNLEAYNAKARLKMNLKYAK